MTIATSAASAAGPTTSTCTSRLGGRCPYPVMVPPSSLVHQVGVRLTLGGEVPEPERAKEHWLVRYDHRHPHLPTVLTDPYLAGHPRVGQVGGRGLLGGGRIHHDPLPAHRERDVDGLTSCPRGLVGDVVRPVQRPQITGRVPHQGDEQQHHRHDRGHEHTDPPSVPPVGPAVVQLTVHRHRLARYWSNGDTNVADISWSAGTPTRSMSANVTRQVTCTRTEAGVPTGWLKALVSISTVGAPTREYPGRDGRSVTVAKPSACAVSASRASDAVRARS